MADYRTSRFQPAPDEPTESLDEDQLAAFRLALTVPDLLMVLGPPGTGKTRTISQIARACAFGVDGDREPGRGLVTSHTHRAVNNVLARLPADLLRIRVGHDGKVTAEGQPYLLETQAADLRQRILNATSRALAAYADLGIAKQWAEELGRRISTMNTAIAEGSQARSRLSGARRAVGGAAQARVDALAAQRDQQEQELSRHAVQAERLTQRAARARARGSWPLLGLLFGMLARRSEQRLARIQAAATLLRADRDSTQGALARAEQELDAVTRDDPAVQVASAMVTQLSDRRAECRDSALAAAGTCRDLVARVDAPVFVAEKSEAGERGLPAFQAWLVQRLPVLEARAELLAEWNKTNLTKDRKAAWPEVREAHMLAGETDFLLKIVAADWDSYQRFLSAKLTSAANVSHVKSALTLRVSKHDTGVPIVEQPDWGGDGDLPVAAALRAS